MVATTQFTYFTVISFNLQAEAEKKFIDIAAAKEVLTDDGKNVNSLLCLTFKF